MGRIREMHVHHTGYIVGKGCAKVDSSIGGCFEGGERQK